MTSIADWVIPQPGKGGLRCRTAPMASRFTRHGVVVHAWGVCDFICNIDRGRQAAHLDELLAAQAAIFVGVKHVEDDVHQLRVELVPGDHAASSLHATGCLAVILVWITDKQ